MPRPRNCCDRRVTSNRDSSQPSLRLATIYEGRAEYDRAIAEYRRVLEADADNVVAMNNLAFALAVRKGELAESLDLAKARLHARPGLPTIADTVAWIHYLRGEAATAKPLIERACRGGRRQRGNPAARRIHPRGRGRDSQGPHRTRQGARARPCARRTRGRQGAPGEDPRRHESGIWNLGSGIQGRLVNGESGI